MVRRDERGLVSKDERGVVFSLLLDGEVDVGGLVRMVRRGDRGFVRSSERGFVRRNKRGLARRVGQEG